MALPARAWVFLIALPIFTVCAGTLYYYHLKDKEFKKYLQNFQKHEVEIKVPLECVGTLIGRGGTNIKELQEKTNTKIKFQDFDDKYRICKIFGPKENVEEANKLISDIINPKDVEVLEMWVNENACGRIIGRCGDNVRAISRTSNAHISVDRMKSSYNNKLVTIRGKPHEVAKAKEMIDDIIKEFLAQKNFPPRSPRARVKNRKGNGIVPYKIPQYERLIGTPNESMIQVYVSSVASPSHFWLQLISPRAVELDHLVDDMTEYYSKEENQKLHKLKEVKKGQVVASKFQHDEKWYRVEVFSVELNQANPNKSQVDVFYVDYGDSAYYDLEHLFELKPEFLQLKFQAIEASMAGIKPINDKWDETATETFEDMVYSAQWKAMLAQVVCHKTKENSTREGLIPYVRLYDPDGTPGIDVGMQLVEEGFAIPDETDEPLPKSQSEHDDDDDDDDWSV